MKNLLYGMVVLVAFVLMGCSSADAGKDQNVTSGDLVTLDARNSKIDRERVVAYRWQQTEGIAVEISDAESSVATFVAPEVNKTSRLVFMLSVTEDSRYYTSRDYVTILVNPREDKDTTKPVITLLGDTEVHLAVGDNYVDAGATAEDDRDGNITADINIANPVNTQVAGTYMITYNVSDAAGNLADEVHRKVYVNELDTPVVISTQSESYAPEDTVSVIIEGTLSGDQDWAGVYPADANNSWKNVIAWNWVHQGNNTLNKDMKEMPSGAYEVRLFFHNATDVAEAKHTFVVKEAEKEYGQAGTHATDFQPKEITADTTVYFPTDLAEGERVPVVFFASGWHAHSEDYKHTDYTSLLSFIASQGYYVVYLRHGWLNDRALAMYQSALDEHIDHIDTTRIGVVGHSLGGGNTFRILDYFSNEKHYGENGRFIMVIEGWYAWEMDKKGMQSLPANTNIVMQQYGEGGNNAANDTDPRIVLTEYYLLDSIPESQKDYQVYENADHRYPYGEKDYSEMQIILKPLDALMEYTFKGAPEAHDIALEQGSDDPYAKGNGIQVVKPIDEYGSKCSYKSFEPRYDLRYCDMRQFVSIETNTSITKPDYNTAYNEPNFNYRVTRITDRSVQSDNMHPYPKQGSAWNSDMSIIMMGYRLYDAHTFAELAVTSGLDRGEAYAKLGSPWHGAADLRWSKSDPKKFYVLDSPKRFKEVVINADNSDIASYHTLIDMSAEDYSNITTGNNEGNLDYNDTHVVFAAKKDRDNQVYALKYKLSEHTLEWEKAVPHAVWGGGFDWITVGPKAEHIVVSTDGKIYLYDMDLNNERELVSIAEHGDIGINTKGEAVYVQMKSGGGGIWSYNLERREAIKLIDSNHGGGHVSCRNVKHPGWCYVSTAEEGYKEVYGIKLDSGSGVVERFAQTHMSQQNIECMQVNVSPDGKQVLFASDWSEGDAADYRWDKDHNMSCTDDQRHIKIDTYLVKSQMQ